MAINLHLQNLSRLATNIDIRRFFYDFDIPEGGVQIVGGKDGDAFVAFRQEDELLRALQFDGQSILEKPIRLYLAKRDDMERVIEKRQKEIEDSLKPDKPLAENRSLSSRRPYSLDEDPSISSRRSYAVQEGLPYSSKRPSRMEESPPVSGSSYRMEESPRPSGRHYYREESPPLSRLPYDIEKSTFPSRRPYSVQSSPPPSSSSTHGRSGAYPDIDSVRYEHESKQRRSAVDTFADEDADRYAHKRPRMSKSFDSDWDDYERGSSQNKYDSERHVIGLDNQGSGQAIKGDQKVWQDVRATARRDASLEITRQRISQERDGNREEYEPGYIEATNVPCTVTTRDLREFFSRYEIPQNGIKMKNDDQDAKSLIAFVKFASIKDAVKVDCMCDGFKLHGQSISITLINKIDFELERPSKKVGPTPPMPGPQGGGQGGPFLQNVAYQPQFSPHLNYYQPIPYAHHHTTGDFSQNLRRTQSNFKYGKKNLVKISMSGKTSQITAPPPPAPPPPPTNLKFVQKTSEKKPEPPKATSSQFAPKTSQKKPAPPPPTNSQFDPSYIKKMSYIRIKLPAPDLPPEVTACQLWSMLGGRAKGCGGVILIFLNGRPHTAMAAFDYERTRDRATAMVGCVQSNGLAVHKYLAQEVTKVQAKIFESTPSGSDRQITSKERILLISSLKPGIQQNQLIRSLKRKFNLTVEKQSPRTSDAITIESKSQNDQNNESTDKPKPGNSNQGQAKSMQDQSKTTKEGDSSKKVGPKECNEKNVTESKEIEEEATMDDESKQIPQKGEEAKPDSQGVEKQDWPAPPFVTGLSDPLTDLPEGRKKPPMAEYTCFIKLQPEITACEIWSWFKGAKGPAEGVRVVRDAEDRAVFAFVRFIERCPTYSATIRRDRYKLCDHKSMIRTLSSRLKPGYKVGESSDSGEDLVYSYDEIQSKLVKKIRDDHEKREQAERNKERVREQQGSLIVL